MSMLLSLKKRPDRPLEHGPLAEAAPRMTTFNNFSAIASESANSGPILQLFLINVGRTAV